MQKSHTRLVLALLSALPLGTGLLRAQTAPNVETVPAKPEEEVVALSPFIVEAGEDTGYLANATVAGTRVRTELKDVASSIQVVTSQFMRDVGAKDNLSLLQYTTNTEIGGIYGNFGGVGSTFIEGAQETATNLLRPNFNTRVRGLDSADNTRDLIQTDIPWNGFDVGRVDFQRGPNSILFGLGSPAGIINATVDTANFKNEGSFENQLDRFGSNRNTLKINHVLIPDELAIRVNGTYDDQRYRQRPAYNLNRSYFGAIRWEPKLFGKNSTAHTTIRANFEHGKVTSNRPRDLPPIDKITPFFNANQYNKQLIDPYTDYELGAYPWTGRLATGGEPANYWLGGPAGMSVGANPVVYYNNTGNPTPISAAQGAPYWYYAMGHTMGGYPYANAAGINGYGDWAKSLQQNGAADGASAAQLAEVAGAQGGFYKNKSITDPSIFDFYNNLLDGPTKREWQNWRAYNISVEQTFFRDRLSFQFVYDREKYDDGGQSILGWQPTISVDVMKNNLTYPSAYATSDNPFIQSVIGNPNAGRAYVAGSGGGSQRITDRRNVVLTGSGKLAASDFLGKGMLADILGHHVVTGIYTSEKYDVEDRSYSLYAATGLWSELIGRGYNNGGDGTGGIRSGDVNISNVVYLSGSLVNTPSASGLNLSRIQSNISPPTSGSLSIGYMNAHWNKPTDPTATGYVDPTAPWTNPTTIPVVPDGSTQASNPLNYAGWQTANVPILNADRGDINQLYTSGTKIRKETTSKGGTWQAYLWDDTIVATFGYRRDRQDQRAGAADQDITGVANMNYGLNPLQPNGTNTATSKSWGVVVHTPRAIRKNLPWGTDISLSYSDGHNERVENRYGFNAQSLPNAKGSTKDIALAISTLDDRLTLKVTHYDTKVRDANISSVTTQVSTLGSNTGEMENLEAWGVASALMDQAGIEGHFPGWDWYWNWANISGGYPNAYDNNEATDPAFLNNPETIKEKAAIQSWMDQLLPQSWYDAFGYPIDVTKAKALDWAHAISNGAWQPPSYVGSLQGSSAGKVNGAYPTGTVDNESKGWEFEVAGKPLKNLDISFNAAKQTAQQTALGTDLVSFILSRYEKYQSPAGDLRLWWGGDNNLRTYFTRDIWAAYLFQQNTNGKMVSEMSPWRCNFTANYAFDHGLLKGVNVGTSYRWQQGVILGYALNSTQDNLDVNKPYWGPSQDAFDCWVGYGRKLGAHLDWRIQVNLWNVGQKAHLTPISVEPNGDPAQYRIVEGMRWQLSNTFSF